MFKNHMCVHLSTCNIYLHVLLPVVYCIEKEVIKVGEKVTGFYGFFIKEFKGIRYFQFLDVTPNTKTFI